MRGFAILLGFNLLGALLRQWAHIPLPANVLGLLAFLAALFTGWVKAEWVEREADWLIRHMMLFFAPLLVGAEVYFRYIEAHWLLLGVSWLLSTLAAMYGAGWTAKLLLRDRREGEAS